MKAVVNRKALESVLRSVKPFANQKSVKPILRCVKLTFSETHGSRVEATDLDHSIRVRLLGANVSRSGSVCVNHAALLAVVASLREESLLLVEDSGALRVIGAACERSIPCESCDNFPSLKECEESEESFPRAHACAVDGAVLGAASTRLAECCDPESTRYALGGILVEHTGADSLTLTATDCRRLASESISAENSAPKKSWRVQSSVGQPMHGLVIVPSVFKALSSACKAAGYRDSRILIHAASNGLRFACEDAGVVIFSKAIEGRFPRYRDIFPDGTPQAVLSLRAADLAELCRVMAGAITEESRAVDFTIDDNRLSATTSNPTNGKTDHAIDCKIESQDRSFAWITLDPRYLLDSVKHLPKDARVEFKIWSPKTPCQIRLVDSLFKYVLMPMQRERGSNQSEPTETSKPATKAPRDRKARTQPTKPVEEIAAECLADVVVPQEPTSKQETEPENETWVEPIEEPEITPTVSRPDVIATIRAGNGPDKQWSPDRAAGYDWRAAGNPVCPACEGTTREHRCNACRGKGWLSNRDKARLGYRAAQTA